MWRLITQIRRDRRAVAARAREQAQCHERAEHDAAIRRILNQASQQ